MVNQSLRTVVVFNIQFIMVLSKQSPYLLPYWKAIQLLMTSSKHSKCSKHIQTHFSRKYKQLSYYFNSYSVFTANKNAFSNLNSSQKLLECTWLYFLISWISKNDSHYTSTLLGVVNVQKVSKLSELGTSGNPIKGSSGLILL